MIGVFDSGIGGLSVLRQIRETLPTADLAYVGDQAHVPYGSRSLEEIRRYSDGIAGFLIGLGARVVVVACNTASGAALAHLREHYPDTLFVGMEPAVKPAAEHTQSGVVGVLATPGTFRGELYSSVVERFARDVTLLEHTCPGLVNEIESGQLDSPRLMQILREALTPMLNARIDTVVLGCTHYPFAIPAIRQIVGPGIQVIDPAPAVAKQVLRVYSAAGPGIENSPHPHTVYFTSGDAARMSVQIKLLLGLEAHVSQLDWVDGALQVRRQ